MFFFFFFMSFESALQALNAGDAFEAEKQLRRLVNKPDSPDPGSAEFSLGLVLERQDRLDEAAEWLSRAVALKTDVMQRALTRKILASVLGRIPGREAEARVLAEEVAQERLLLLGPN